MNVERLTVFCVFLTIQLFGMTQFSIDRGIIDVVTKSEYINSHFSFSYPQLLTVPVVHISITIPCNILLVYSLHLERGWLEQGKGIVGLLGKSWTCLSISGQPSVIYSLPFELGSSNL